MQKPASLFSLVIFWLIALLQVLRIVFQVRVTAGGVEIPIWASLFPALFFAAFGGVALGGTAWVARRSGVRERGRVILGALQARNA